MLPQVSVIIPAYNCTSSLGLQLRSLVRQESIIDFEIIICDNNSSDNLEEWLAEWRNDYSFIRYIDASQIPGAAYARNMGARHAKAHKLAFCDGDDVVSKNWVQAASEALEHSSVVTGSIHTVFEEEFTQLTTIQECDHLIQEEIKDLSDTDLVPVKKGSIAPVLLGGNFAITKEQYMALGGFDVGFSKGSEDNEFSYRIMKAGIKLQYCPAMGLLYRIRKPGFSLLKRSYQTGRTFADLCEKHNAWDEAVPYHGFSYLSAPKSFVKALLISFLSKPEQRLTQWATFFTVIGLTVGRLKSQVDKNRT